MIAALAFLNANKNIIGAALLVMLGVMIVSGSYVSGQRAEQRKLAAATARINGVIVEQRGKDEAEVAALEREAERIDAAVKAALNQRFILDDDTVRTLNSVK